MTTQEWKEEFEKELCELVPATGGAVLYWRNWHANNLNMVPTPYEVESFIESMLASQRKEWVSLEDAYEEYIDFLEEHIGGNAVYLEVHGMGATLDEAEKGKELRWKIKDLSLSKEE